MLEGMIDGEVLAGIRVLVVLAKADGTIHDAERMAIENALGGVELPPGITVETLLAEDIDLTVELARISSEEGRRRTYDASCAIVYVDGDFSDGERVLLARVADAFNFDAVGRAERFRKFKSATPPPKVSSTKDAAARERLVHDEIVSAASFSAALASLSLPIAAESCLFTNNVRLVRNIGLTYGQQAGDGFWRTFVGNIVGAAGSWFAVSSLLKLVPGGTSSVAAAAYASTHALGTVTRRYFDEGESLGGTALKDAFAEARKAALGIAKDARADIVARTQTLKTDKAPLDAKLAAGEMTETAYANQLVALA